MRNKAVANEMLLCGSIKGIILGTINATATLIKSVYIVMSAPSPPNFCVTTEADVAVGHIIHNRAASTKTLPLKLGDFNESRNNNDTMEEFKFLLKVLVIVGIPSVLTFIEPDTGAVLIYFIITVVMLFVGGFKARWFVITTCIILICGGVFLGIYFMNQDLFIDIFGTSFFYRMDRILNWSNSNGLQLTNGLTAIGSGGMLGHGFNHTPIYFPEMQTDFIFAVFASNFGFLGTLLLLGLIVFFDLNIISLANKSHNDNDKLLVGGIIAVLLFQQMQNIGMTLGLLPIMGITLPFISYGGSSLLSYMILIGMLFNISNENLRFKN